MDCTLPWWRVALLKAFRVRVRYCKQTVHALKSGPAILCCNHLSMLDGVIIALASPTPLVFAVNRGHARQNPFTRTGLYCLSACGLGQVVAIDSENPSGLRSLLRALRSGQSVMVFPQGGIARGGEDKPDKPGVKWLAQKSGARVLALHLRGVDRSRWFAPDGKHWWPRVFLRF